MYTQTKKWWQGPGIEWILCMYRLISTIHKCKWRPVSTKRFFFQRQRLPIVINGLWIHNLHTTHCNGWGRDFVDCTRYWPREAFTFIGVTYATLQWEFNQKKLKQTNVAEILLPTTWSTRDVLKAQRELDQDDIIKSGGLINAMVDIKSPKIWSCLWGMSWIV